jgi:hypothetical protein
MAKSKKPLKSPKSPKAPKPPAKRPRGRPRTERYDTIDWDMRDVDIARKLGVTRQAVNAKRKELGMVRPRDTEKWDKLMAWTKVNYTSGLTTNEIIRRTGIDATPPQVGRFLLRNAIPYRVGYGYGSQTNPLQGADLRLPTAVIAEIYRVAEKEVLAYRRKMRRPNPKWKVAPAPGAAPEDYVRAVDAARHHAVDIRRRIKPGTTVSFS